MKVEGTHTTVKRTMPDEFASHAMFKELDVCYDAYDALAGLVFGFITPSTTVFGNIDSYFLDSLAGTVESMSSVLRAGRISDAYTLLRRFRETSLLQVYVLVRHEERQERLGELLNDSFATDSEEFLKGLQDVALQGIYVEEVEKWLRGETSPPKLRMDSESLARPGILEQVRTLADQTRHKEIVDRCNNHVHLGSFQHLWANASHRPDVLLFWLEQFAQDYRDLVSWHLAHVLAVRPMYMASSDYIDALDCGVEPEEDSQYWVAPIVQQLFDEVITPHNPSVTEFLKENTSMELK